MNKLYKGYKIAKMIARGKVKDNTYLYRIVEDRKMDIYITHLNAIFSTKVDMINGSLVYDKEVTNSYFTDENTSFEIIEDKNVIYDYITDILQDEIRYNENQISKRLSIIDQINQRNAILGITTIKKLTVGDKVAIREDLSDDNTYGDFGVVEEMIIYRDKTAIITRVREDDSYELNIDGGRYSWTEEMFK